MHLDRHIPGGELLIETLWPTRSLSSRQGSQRVKPDLSVTRRLAATVLVVELLSVLVLICALAIHEHYTQLKSFDAMLRGDAQAMIGAVQEAEDQQENVMLDLRELHIPKSVVYRVEDEGHRVVGQQGQVPSFETNGEQPIFRMQRVAGKSYRFVTLHGTRYTDPGSQKSETRHSITILYGAPVGHVWWEVWEAIQFAAIAASILLGVTTLLIIVLLRQGLSPIYQLAHAAERIHSDNWCFDVPTNARRTVELRPLTDALEGAMRRVQLSFEQQRRFTSDAAHELKTDVAIIKSSFQLLKMRKRTAKEYDRGLAQSLEDFTRLETSVQKMLTLARLEQPKEHANPVAAPPLCSLGEVSEEAVHQTIAFSELRRVKVVTSCQSGVVVALDRTDALLLCSNVLLNALQHSPEGGRVDVDLNYDGQMAHLTVQDQGEGILEEDRPYLFNPFYRNDPSRSRKNGGTGLGLSICKAICKRGNGRIDIANGSEGGARVTIDLPARLCIPE